MEQDYAKLYVLLKMMWVLHSLGVIEEPERMEMALLIMKTKKSYDEAKL